MSHPPFEQNAAEDRSIALVADAHLDGPGGDAAGLVDQLEAIEPERCQWVVFLGDLFHVWVGDPRFETPSMGPLAAAISGLRQRGMQTAYIEGNRDFFLRGSCYEKLFDHLGLELALRWRGRRFLFVHGDGINDRDRQYLVWRWLSKNAVSRTVFAWTPRSLARRVVFGAESRLARTNFKHKARVPEEAIRAYGGRRLDEGFDVVVLGHFHEPCCWRVGAGEVRVLDAWFRSRRIEWLSAADERS